MMGKQNEQKSLFCYSINLDKRIRRGHPLRQVLEVVDFDFVRDEVEQFYGANGNVSVDPVIILKLMFLLFWDDVKSERALMDTLPEPLDYLWFLGYGLDDDVPHHSVLSKARRRWGCKVFERLFIQTIEQCIQHGLVDGSKIHVDSSLIDAHSSKDRVYKASPELIASLKEISLAEASKLEDTQVAGTYESGNDKHFCTTDPDATLVRRPGKPSAPRYHHHRVVDDQTGIITAVDTTTGSIAEDHKLSDLMDQHERHTGRCLETVVADAKYGTVSNYLKCQDKAIQSHFKSQSEKGANTGRREGIFSEKDFIYNPNSNTYTCPANQVLKPRRLHSRRQTYEYITSKGICLKCHLKSQCTRSKTGRTIRRHLRQEELDIARSQSVSEAARRDLNRRKYLIEGSFADAANNHHFKRARWRRIWRQRIQDFLIAGIQNIKKLLKAIRSNGQAFTPCVANDINGANLRNTLILLVRFLPIEVRTLGVIQNLYRQN